MREIKFRAWDKKYKQWVSCRTGMFVEDGIPIAYDRKSGEEGQYVFYSADGLDIELMQFTGFLDKNGKPICEGDIVKFNRYIGTIIFECGCFGIGFNKAIDYDAMIEEIHEVTGCNNPLDSCQNDNFISLWEIHWNYNEDEHTLYSVELIGNIYENPELLHRAEAEDVV